MGGGQLLQPRLPESNSQGHQVYVYLLRISGKVYYSFCYNSIMYYLSLELNLIISLNFHFIISGKIYIHEILQALGLYS